MGYRAHTITQHREYGSTVFCDWDKFHDYLSDLRGNYDTEGGDMYVFNSDSEDYQEISKAIIKEEIKALKKLPPDGLHPTLKENNEYVIGLLESMLEEAPASDSYVALEWY